MTDKRPTSQHLTKEADYGVSGDLKSLKQLSSSGKEAQKRRGKTPAKQAAPSTSRHTSSKQAEASTGHENTSQQ